MVMDTRLGTPACLAAKTPARRASRRVLCQGQEVRSSASAQIRLHWIPMTQTPRSSHKLPLAGRPVDAELPFQEREAEIARLVGRFYALGREDPVLGPVFESRVSNWPRHLEAMRAFWGSAIYRTGRYHGRPLEVHKRISEIRPEHFERWLQLWEQAVGETVRPEARTPLMAMAHRMAETMAPKVCGPSR